MNSTNTYYSGMEYQQKNVYQYETAGFWLRFFAYFYDQFIGSLLFFLFFLLLIFLGGKTLLGSDRLHDLSILSSFSHHQLSNYGVLTIPLIVFFFVITPLLFTLLYGAFFESSRYSATPGKMLLGLYVVDKNGQRLTFAHAFERNFYKYLGNLIIIGCAILAVISGVTGRADVLSSIIILLGMLGGGLLQLGGHLMIAITADNQGWYDKRAVTYVEKDPNASTPRRAFFIVLAIAFIVVANMYNYKAIKSKSRIDYSHQSQETTWRTLAPTYSK